MDAMFRPYNFHKTFFCSYSYVFTLVIPNTIFVYWGFPTEAALYGKLHCHTSCLQCCCCSTVVSTVLLSLKSWLAL